MSGITLVCMTAGTYAARVDERRPEGRPRGPRRLLVPGGAPRRGGRGRPLLGAGRRAFGRQHLARQHLAALPHRERNPRRAFCTDRPPHQEQAPLHPQRFVFVPFCLRTSSLFLSVHSG